MNSHRCQHGLITLDHGLKLPNCLELLLILPIASEEFTKQTALTRFNIASHTGEHQQVVDLSRHYLKKNLQQNIVFMDQTHGTNILTLDQISAYNDLSADGIVSRSPNTACMVQTADCVPLILYSLEAPIIAAIHVGWKGLIAGIIPKALEQMRSENSCLKAFIGPAICCAHFQINIGMASDFAARAEKLAYPKQTLCDAGRWYVDLKETVKQELNALGVMQVEKNNKCTYESADLPSYRRAQHTGVECKSRLVSLIRFKSGEAEF